MTWAFGFFIVFLVWVSFLLAGIQVLPQKKDRPIHFGNTAPSEPPWGGQFQGSPSMKLPKGMSQTPEVPATQLGLQLQLCPAELKKSAILGT